MSTRDPDVPRLPRGRGIRLSTPQIFKIIFIAALLVAVIVLTRPCADAAGRFVGSFDETVDAGAGREPTYHRIEGTTDEEIRKELEKIQNGSGTGTGTGTGSEDQRQSEA